MIKDDIKKRLKEKVNFLPLLEAQAVELCMIADLDIKDNVDSLLEDFNEEEYISNICDSLTLLLTEEEIVLFLDMEDKISSVVELHSMGVANKLAENVCKIMDIQHAKEDKPGVVH